MEDGFSEYRTAKPGMCVNFFLVLKVILYVELVLFFGLFFVAAVFYSIPVNYHDHYYDSTLVETDYMENTNSTEFLSKNTELPVASELNQNEKTTEEVTEKTISSEDLITENSFVESKPLEIETETSDDGEDLFLRIGPIIFSLSKIGDEDSLDVERIDNGEMKVEEIKKSEEPEMVTASLNKLDVSCDGCKEGKDSSEEKVHIVADSDHTSVEPERETKLGDDNILQKAEGNPVDDQLIVDKLFHTDEDYIMKDYQSDYDYPVPEGYYNHFYL